jgi:hypothetical protein
VTTKKTRRRVAAPCLTRRHERKTDRLFKTIRELAAKQVKEKPQLFLSLRQAARRFDVPVSTMTAIYRRLIEEGVLSTVRASRTILRGRNTSRNLKVRGLIGMPLSRPRLRTSPGYRECSLRISEELHARGFAITPFYFEERDIEPNFVIERSNKEKVDMLIWLLPDGANRDTASHLRDLGIRFIGVNIGGVSGAFCRYEVRREQAILTILNEWQAGMKLGTAVIVLAGHETPAEKEMMARLSRLLAVEQIHCDLVNVPKGHISIFLKSLCANRSNGILLPASAAAMLASRAPDTVAEVLKTRCVAWIDGLPDLLCGQGAPDIRIDLVSVDWRAIGERIARDILSGDAFRQSERTIFEAEAHLHVPLFSEHLASASPTRKAPPTSREIECRSRLAGPNAWDHSR